jgi:hypothetical protein
MLPPGSFKLWNVDKDRAFGDDFFDTATAIRNFVEDSGYLRRLLPKEHPWWRPQLTKDVCRRGGPLEHVKTDEWATYLEDRDIHFKIPRKEWERYKQTQEPSGMKHRKKDILIKRALEEQESDVLAAYACSRGVYRLLYKLFFSPGQGESVEDNCTRRGITVEQHRALNNYFKDRGVIATLHHLANYEGGRILRRFLLPPLPEKKIPGPRKPRASRTGRRRESAMTVFKTKAAFEKHIRKHTAGVVPLTRTQSLPFSRDDHNDNVAFLAIARTTLGKLCAAICTDAGLKKLGRLDPESAILYKVKMAAPCEEEIASYQGRGKPYVWYFCVYDYTSYVNIRANFKMIQDPISCDITAMCYVSPSKTAPAVQTLPTATETVVVKQEPVVRDLLYVTS